MRATKRLAATAALCGLGLSATALVHAGRPATAAAEVRGAVGPRLVASDARRPAGADTLVRRSGAADRDAVSITVYNQNFGLVREVRTVETGLGAAELEFADVASSIQTETVAVRALDRAPFRVLEQSYRYDLLSPGKLLEKYVGRTVRVYRWNEAAGREEAAEAEVLAVNGGTILRIGDEITFGHPGRLAFPEVPDDLIAEPTLVWLLESGAQRRRVEVSYLADSLDWKADYVVVVDEDDARGDLTGWVTLTNRSGATWEDAELKLVAGDVRRLGRSEIRMRAAMALEERAADPGFREEAFFEYHFYTLDRPTTVRNQEQKQITLLEADRFGIRKRLIFHGAPSHYRGRHGILASDAKVGVYLDFENSEANGLGLPLPAGVVRVYKEDGSGAQQFIGEDRIDHTPRDEKVRIRMGEAFDVVADRRQMEWTALGGCASESAWRISLRNHKDEAVQIQVVEPIGGDWRIVTSTHEATRIDARTFRFDVSVGARDEATVEYRVRVRWC